MLDRKVKGGGIEWDCEALEPFYLSSGGVALSQIKAVQKMIKNPDLKSPFTSVKSVNLMRSSRLCSNRL